VIFIVFDAQTMNALQLNTLQVNSFSRKARVLPSRLASSITTNCRAIYPNPTKYDPGRFLPENTAKRHAYDFIPSSAGPRNCIGQKFAQSELRIVLSWILRRFRFVTDRPLDSQKYSVEATLRPVNGMRLTVMKR
ncbi:hypothetical protein PMAYCL1PPCAC_08088, partial [Pristionchus mayeri]